MKPSIKKLIVKNGFTLIEILISLVIFSFMIGLASYSFRFYVNILSKTETVYPLMSINYSKLRDALASLMCYIGEKSGIGDKIYFYNYFYGYTNKLIFISNEPIINTQPSLCELYYDNGSLMWKESPIFLRKNNYKNPFFMKKSKKEVLIKNIKKLKIYYFFNNKKFKTLIEKFPECILISFINKNNKRIDWYFKIESFCKNRRKFIEYLYHQE